MPDAGIREALVREGASRLLDARLQTIVRVASPAAGAEWITKVPGGTYWQLLCVSQTLVTSAVVANRTATLQVRDGDNGILARFGPQNTQPASSTAGYNWSTGYGATNPQGFQGAPLPTPPILLLGGWSLGSSTPSLDATDQYSAIVLTVREFSESQLAQELAVIADALGSIL